MSETIKAIRILRFQAQTSLLQAEMAQHAAQEAKAMGDLFAGIGWIQLARGARRIAHHASTNARLLPFMENAKFKAKQ